MSKYDILWKWINENKTDDFKMCIRDSVECVPGLLLEFLDTLPRKNENTQLSFILQGGFAEGCQYRCGEQFLEKLPAYLGCSYGGCLVKCDNFSIRLLEKEQQDRKETIMACIEEYLENP